MTSKRKPNPNKRDTSQPPVKANRGGDEKLIAQTILRPTVQAASTLQQYGKAKYGDSDLMGLVAALSDQTNATNKGDLSRGEAMLTAQAHTLDAIFNNLAQRAALNMGKYMTACEIYLKFALRAQSQCRATWETLSTIKNPPVAGYVGQANIARGHQQVNNAAIATASRTRENGNMQNELLEQTDGERLDLGATGTTSKVDSGMETMGEVDRTKVSGG